MQWKRGRVLWCATLRRKRDESTIADTPDFAYEDICVGEEPMEQSEREDTRRVRDTGDETVGNKRSGVRPEHEVHVGSSVNAKNGRQKARAENCLEPGLSHRRWRLYVKRQEDER